MNTNFEIVLSFSCKLLNFPSSSRDLLQARIGFILENWMSHYSDNMRSWTMPGKHYTTSLRRLLKQLTNNITTYQYKIHQTLPKRGTASAGESWQEELDVKCWDSSEHQKILFSSCFQNSFVHGTSFHIWTFYFCLKIRHIS